MSESQSRYSIVERLTRSKIDILEEGIGIKENISIKENNLVNMETEFKNWEEEVVQENKIERSRRLAIIEKARRELENSKQRAESKKEIVSEKIATIDSALKSIEDISKSSPTINK